MADSGRMTGWKYDIQNGYLEVFVRGTRVAYFDDATADMTLLVNGLKITAGGLTVTAGGITVSSGVVSVDDTTASTTGSTGSVHTLGGMGIAKDVVVGGGMDIIGKLTYADAIYPTNAKIVTVTTDTNVTQAQSGTIFLCATDSTEISLPAMSDGTLRGCTYTFINIGTDDATEISINPGTADKILGCDLAGVVNKDLINTAATSKMGDMVRLVCDGTITWYVQKMVGTWAAQA